MKNELVYEIINDSLNPYLIVPLFITVIIFILLIVSFLKKKAFKLNPSQVVGLVVFIAFAILSIYNIFKIKQYNQILDDYKKGNYQIVEGVVEDFLPLAEGRNTESFSVGEVKFVLPNNIGYKGTTLDGSFIQGNGQKVKIGYITIDGINYIVRLELING